MNDFSYSIAKKNAAETGFLMQAAGQCIVTVLADEGYVDKKTNSSWIEPLLSQRAIDAVFLYEFNGYSELKGSISFVAGKPIIGGRFNLWSPDFYDVEQLAAALKSLPNLTDVSSEQGYSLIPVHAWSHTVTDVLKVKEILERDGRFEVVLPSELVRRVVAHCVH